ncbi:hypothetical protein [Chitinimonas sp. BJYL2]|uniref:hypothetical protein n=1 Tax=Chitinimonas sp. BJYL2 TaxID=2976696 RepID=UPI0022B55D3D|nr:hypothetical protein [Chitinimonas sp. BJYL2]
MPNPQSSIGIVINLDYLCLPYDLCRKLWTMVEGAMLSAGFVLDGRVFVSGTNPDVVQRARDVMKRLEPAFEALGVSQFEAIRDFYSFDLSTRVDLNIVDSISSVEVYELPV